MEVLLVGRSEEVLKAAETCGITNLPSGVEIRNATEVVEISDESAMAFKRKPDSSLTVGLNLLKSGEGDAFVSAGSTGALLSGATLVTLVGVGQAIATCPGISRSGMTICMGMFRGFDRTFAVRFSFLLSIPAVLGANILSIVEAVQGGGIDLSQLPVYLVGVAAAAVSGYLCIRLLRMIADKGRFGWFAYYCWFAGVGTLILTFMK